MPSERYLKFAIEEDALREKKMAFISGPRQVGKTFLGKVFLSSPQNYFSWDQSSFRKAWAKDPLQAIAEHGAGPILIDEIHKDRRWKTRLKGIYDTVGDTLPILVTGSARLDVYRRGGDSLMGRYFPYRLHPFTIAELPNPPAPNEVFTERELRFRWDDLNRLSGFPEPLLRGSESSAKRWSRLRLERLVFEDTRDLRAIGDLNAMRVLVDLLPERAGSLLSINSLREDVGVAYATVRAWVQLLEALYYCFLIRPYSGTLRRTLTTEPKLYLFDPLQLPEDTGRRNENLAALHLFKTCQYWTDTAQGEFELQFIRTKERKEVDFVIVRDRKPWMLIECKSNSKAISPHLAHFSRQLKTRHNFQLVSGARFNRHYPEPQITVIDYETFFSGWV